MPVQVSIALAGLLMLPVLSAGCSPSASPTAPAASVVEIDIDVSPNVLNIASQGEVVTVHTNLPFGDVAASSVSLNGVSISTWKADDRGQFVAKFLMTAVKDIPLTIGAFNRITLEGTTIDERRFRGTQDILVVNNAAGAEGAGDLVIERRGAHSDAALPPGSLSSRCTIMAADCTAVRRDHSAKRLFYCRWAAGSNGTRSASRVEGGTADCRLDTRRRSSQTGGHGHDEQT